ncbi:MAG: hypothetical protein IKK18_04015 [Clostridia bacterium]|nr:hypothetical protein [Clostridia bacterium]
MKNKVIIGVLCCIILIMGGITLVALTQDGNNTSDLPKYKVPFGTPKSDICLLDEHIPTNGPVIINANEGSVTEIRSFDANPQEPNQISDNQIQEKFKFAIGEGVEAGIDSDNYNAHVSIKKDHLYQYSEKAAKHFFCDDCLAAFEEVNPDSNFIVADTYDPDNIKFYDLKDIDESLAIRHYSLLFDYEDEYLYSFNINSSYFYGGQEFDYLYIPQS